MRLTIVFVLFVSLNLSAQEETTIKQSLLIIHSTKSYSSALRKAQEACNKLGLTLNLYGNYEDKETGLTNNIVGRCGERTGYVPRLCIEPGNYVSIEYSSWVQGIQGDLYLVVVSSGARSELKKELSEVKSIYKKAYIKDAEIRISSE